MVDKTTSNGSCRTVTRYHENSLIFASCKIPEFSDKSLLSEAKKHPDFQVTSCHHFVTTNVDFANIESE